MSAGWRPAPNRTGSAGAAQHSAARAGSRPAAFLGLLSQNAPAGRLVWRSRTGQV